MALERFHDIFWRQGLAIVELDALTDVEIPFGEIVRALDGFRETVLDLALGRDPDERVAELARQVKGHLARRERGVERIRPGAAAKTEAKRATLFRAFGTDGMAQHGARRRGGDAERGSPAKEGPTVQPALGRALHQKSQLVAHRTPPF